MRNVITRMTFFLLAGLTLFCAATPAYAAKKLLIESFDYRQHFNPGETVAFTVTVKNNETTTEFAEIDVTLTNLGTHAESTLTPVMTTIIAAGATAVLQGNYTPAAGSYTVTFPLFDGDGARSDRVNGRYPLHIGTETESLRVYPENIELGEIPAGRYQYPMPVEINWSYFRFNRMRHDQPFTIRVYTDNAPRYHGIPKSIRRGSPAGLISADGKYLIPIKIWTLNFGPDLQEDGWDSPLAGPPPVDDDDYWVGPPLIEGTRSLGSASWVRIPDLIDMTPNPSSWRRLIGQDPYDNRFATDTNLTGDYTLRSPFTVYLATDAQAYAVEGSYSTTLVVELWTP